MTETNMFIEAKLPTTTAFVTFLETGLASLPSEFRVTYFGSGEKPLRRPKFEIDNREFFHEYLRRYEHSVTLFGDGFSLDATPLVDMPSELVFHVTELYSKRTAQVQDLFRLFDGTGAIYAFAALFEEMDARNGYDFRLSISTRVSHGWVGRDFRRYVPGLYWMNYFSDAYILQHKISISKLATDLNVELTRLTRGFLLQLYAAPSDWTRYTVKVDEVIFNTPEFFSRRRVDLPELVEPQEHLQFLAMLQKDWP